MSLVGGSEVISFKENNGQLGFRKGLFLELFKKWSDVLSDNVKSSPSKAATFTSCTQDTMHTAINQIFFSIII